MVVAGMAMGLAGAVLAQATGSDGDPWWLYATIPIVAGAIGWGTNWLAVKMTFWPLEYVGILKPYLGWQGIIPSRARKMASIATDSTITKVGSLTDVMNQMEPDRIAAHVLETARPQVPALVDEIASEKYPRLWANTPPPVKDAVYDRAQRLLPRALNGLVEDMTANIEDILDVRLMVIDQLSSDKRMLNRIFIEAGKKEFQFLVNSGFTFGFLLGIPQMIMQIVYPTWWTLPLFGLLVGYITNWLALTMIFEPAEPRKIGPFVLQGMMLKRQAEISAYFADTASTEMLTIRHFAERMLNGPKSDRAIALVRRHVEPTVDEALGILRPAVTAMVGSRELDEVREALSTRALSMAVDPFEDETFVASRGKLVRAEMYKRLTEMNPEEFTGLLRPTVEEDEWKLIAVGAVLGGLAGLAQSLLVFA